MDEIPIRFSVGYYNGRDLQLEPQNTLSVIQNVKSKTVIVTIKKPLVGKGFVPARFYRAKKGATVISPTVKAVFWLQSWMFRNGPPLASHDSGGAENLRCDLWLDINLPLVAIWKQK
jgi:hypothetical protein